MSECNGKIPLFFVLIPFTKTNISVKHQYVTFELKMDSDNFVK